MPQSLAAVYVHIVFSTKDRVAYIQNSDLRNELHSYLGGTSNHLGCPPTVTGGVEDHIHLLARQARTVCLADWVKELKTGSSKWMKERGVRRFAWQSGYGAFSVSAGEVQSITSYIQNQETHHHKFSFQDELRDFLRKSGMEWDEEYVWD